MEAKSRRRWVIGLAVVGAMVGVAIVAVVGLNAYSWDCRCDDQIAADQRAAVGAVALDFVDRVMGPDPSSSYQLLTASARRTAMPADQLAALYRSRIEQTGRVRDWRVAHSYLVELKGLSDGLQTVPCGEASAPGDRVLVAVKGGPEQAHVLVEGDGAHNRIAFVLWMEMEGGRWRVIETQMRTTTYLGKTATDFEAMAKAEQREQRQLNAALLYLQAQALADRGPRLQLGITPRLVDGFRTVKVPGPLAGDPPFTWAADGSQFKVLTVAPVGISDPKGDDQLYVAVTHEIDPWVDDAVAGRKNQDLIAAFRKSYPSYSRHFAGLVVQVQPKTIVAGAHALRHVYRNEPGSPEEAATAEAPQ